MSDWFDAESAMTDLVQDEFSTPCIRFLPMTKPPNGRRSADKSRQPYDLRGTFDWPWDRAIVKAMEMEHTTRSPTLFVHARDLCYPPVKNCDCVRIPYKGDVLDFEIIDIRPDGLSGVVFDLQQVGLPR